MAFDADDLSPHEHFVMERTRAGEVADFSPMAGPGGAKPAVRAGFLRKLLLELDPSWTVRTPGVRLRGARIEGALDLTDCSGAGGAGLPALALIACEIPEPVNLSHARLARVSFEGSKLTRIVAMETRVDGALDLSAISPMGDPGHEILTARLRGVKIGGDLLAHAAKFARNPSDDTETINLENASVAGSVFLDHGFEVLGSVWLHGVRIGGSLQCNDGKFLNRTTDASGAAIVGDNADIAGDLFMRGEFLAEGQITFEGASIRGNVDIEGSLRNEGAPVLVLRDATIGGTVLLDGSAGCKIAGAVMLLGAKIARNLDLRGAEITHRVKNDAYGCVINAAGLNIGGAALLQGANIKGELFLADARIAGYLALGGGRFINGGNWAIRAPNIRVGGNLSFKIGDDGFAPHGQKTVIEGGAKFDRARVDGSLSWTNVELRGPGPDGSKGAVFSFADASIGGPVNARGLVTQQDAVIDASGASCMALDDDIKTGWGVEGARLELDGFSYARIDAKDERWSQRLKWLNRSGERFSPQPYTHAAQVYARAGRREDARRILLAQHDKRTLAASAGPFTWLLSSLFGLIAGYGLAPIRVVRSLVLYLALGVAGVLAMNAQGALVTPQGQQCNGAVEPALYAVDVALPVIDLGQTSRCGPGRTARAELSQGVALGESDWRLFEGAALWTWAHALYAILGAILTALAVITFSGVMKPKDS